MNSDTLKESADIIDSFLDGSCSAYDWDDFVSISSQIPLIKEVKDYCANSSFRYPPIIESQWCNEEGFRKLGMLAKCIRNCSVDEVASFLDKERNGGHQTKRIKKA